MHDGDKGAFMAFTDLFFLFSFLPVSLAAYYFAKENIREYVLLAVSLVFYACGSFAHLGLFCGAVAVNILLGQLLSASCPGGASESAARNRLLRKALLFTGVLFDVSLLVFYKYIRTDTGLPLGISFFTFKALSYLADTYAGRAGEGNHPVRAALYLSFFPQVQSGPLSRYRDMQRKGSLFSEGACQFIHGFAKKALLADSLGHIPAETFAARPDSMSTAYAWLGAVCYSLQLYYDFSGYSDMAAGISKMFGYSCPRNFQYPYLADSVAAFWRKWHMTLGAWFRDYIYLPLGGSRVSSKGLLYRNLFAVWMLTGIWHGAGWKFVFWGFVYFLCIAFEKTKGLPQTIHSRPGRALYRILTLLIVVFQWVIFRSQGLRAGIRYAWTMV